MFLLFFHTYFIIFFHSSSLIKHFSLFFSRKDEDAVLEAILFFLAISIESEDGKELEEEKQSGFATLPAKQLHNLELQPESEIKRAATELLHVAGEYGLDMD